MTKDFLFINTHNPAISYHMKLIISSREKNNFLDKMFAYKFRIFSYTRRNPKIHLKNNTVDKIHVKSTDEY